MAFGHGLGKLQKATNGGEIDFYELWGMSPELSLWLAVFAEFFAAILLTIGLFSRLSLLPLLFTMAIAAFDVHLDDPYKKMEMSLLYFTVYGCLLFTGPGRYSLDAMIWKR